MSARNVVVSSLGACAIAGFSICPASASTVDQNPANRAVEAVENAPLVSPDAAQSIEDQDSAEFDLFLRSQLNSGNRSRSANEATENGLGVTKVYYSDGVNKPVEYPGSAPRESSISSPRSEVAAPTSLAKVIDWGPCFPWNSSGDVIGRYAAGHPPMAGKFLVNAVLKCGNDNYGYYHIERRHKSQWAALSPDKGNSGWEGIASWALRQTLQSPLSACDVGNQKNLYVGKLVLVQSNKPTKTIYVKSPVGRDTKNVISDYPARNSKCTDVNDPD